MLVVVNLFDFFVLAPSLSSLLSFFYARILTPDLGIIYQGDVSPIIVTLTPFPFPFLLVRISFRSFSTVCLVFFLFVRPLDDELGYAYTGDLTANPVPGPRSKPFVHSGFKTFVSCRVPPVGLEKYAKST